MDEMDDVSAATTIMSTLLNTPSRRPEDLLDEGAKSSAPPPPPPPPAFPPMRQLPPFLQDIIDDQAVSDAAFYTLTVLYTLMILGSVFGNLLVITAVLRSPNMRKVNNILIVNLAVSDLLLCSVVSPMTLMEILFKRWPGPHQQLVCQLSGMVPVCITFVSTLTITGIAIDRYKVIVYSATSRSPPRLATAIISLVSIWSISILLSLPLIFAMTLKVVSLPGPVAAIVGTDSVAYCAEEWGEYKRGRLVFSIFSLVVQFILPITLISFAHNAIKKKLQKLPSWQRQAHQQLRQGRTSATGEIEEKSLLLTTMNLAGAGRLQAPPVISPVCGRPQSNPSPNRVPSFQALRRLSLLGATSKGSNANLNPTPSVANGNADDEMTRLQTTRLQEKIKKQARTHSLLVSIVVVFALSWFPLNVLNIILDIHNIFQNEEVSRICFALCHLIGMSSAFSNPILYGWFNDSFKEEFHKIGRGFYDLFRSALCFFLPCSLLLPALSTARGSAGSERCSDNNASALIEANRNGLNSNKKKLNICREPVRFLIREEDEHEISQNNQQDQHDNIEHQHSGQDTEEYQKDVGREGTVVLEGARDGPIATSQV